MNKYESLDTLNGHPLCVERCRHNLTQKQLAHRANVSTTTIWRAEKDYPISADSRQRLCDYFGLTSQELGLHGEKKRKSSTVEAQRATASPPAAITPPIPNVPNRALRYQRERRNWSQEQVAEALFALRGPTKKGEVNARMISKWERGTQTPNLEYRKLLCQLYEVPSPEDLAFLKPPEEVSVSAPVSAPTQTSLAPVNAPISSHTSIKQQDEIELINAARSLAQLFDNGWSINDILTSVKIVLQGMNGMPYNIRRQLIISPMETHKRPLLNVKGVSEQERTQLYVALRESVVTSWKLFQTTSSVQLLALGQTLLSVVQQVHPLLYPSVRPHFYEGVYSLIGISLHLQERNVEALHFHQNAYLAASMINPLYIVQSLICQADCYTALEQYDLAVQTIKEALALVKDPTNKAETCAKAHLLSCWADNVMMLGDFRTAQEKLEASEEYLDQIAPNEEFDRAGWLLLAGKYALKTKNYRVALSNFESALSKLPEHWTLRRTMTALGLTKAYARLKERERTLEIAKALLPLLQTLNAKLTNRWFAEYLQHDLLTVFPSDRDVQIFVTHTYQTLPELTAY